MAWGLKVWALDSLLSTAVSSYTYFKICLARVILLLICSQTKQQVMEPELSAGLHRSVSVAYENHGLLLTYDVIKTPLIVQSL